MLKMKGSAWSESAGCSDYHLYFLVRLLPSSFSTICLAARLTPPARLASSKTSEPDRCWVWYGRATDKGWVSGIMTSHTLVLA